MVIRRRSSAPPLLPTARPLRAVVIAIDSAKRSGIAVFALGDLVAYSQCGCRNPRDRLRELEAALAHATKRGVPAGLVIEVPYGGNQAAALSLTASAALWRDSWLQLDQPAAHILEHAASAWRRQLFGRGASRLPRDVARNMEALTAARIALRDMGHTAPIGPDAAAAICIGLSALRSGELQRALRCELA